MKGWRKKKEEAERKEAWVELKGREKENEEDKKKKEEIEVEEGIED